MDSTKYFGVTIDENPPKVVYTIRLVRNAFKKGKNIRTKIVGLYPKGSPSRNSRRPEQNPGLRGGLEIVFNQQ
ncbi:uncharacterized protein LOC133784937 [Humulus lupulus]|uniref:uncharacterized protein LOC133784937 n=1 Tax=Humulus lupulus TaxID=3486 RepID=UPI002B4071B8|nr:uncharacterized protein LOC133784937 [Humulus lupulus]